MDERCEVQARLSVLLRVRLDLPSADLHRTSEQEQVLERRYRDRIRALREGRVVEVERDYLEAWSAVRDPGAGTRERGLDPLHERRLRLVRDEAGARRVEVSDGGPAPPDAAIADERLRERYEAVLPPEPVALGARWSVEGAAFRRALGPGLGRDPTGRIACTFQGARRVALDAGGAARDYAVVALELQATGRQGAEDEAAHLHAAMQGELLFDLARAKIAAVELRGTARLEQTRGEAGHELRVQGEGPVEIRKRFWYPRRPRRRR